MEQIPTCLHFVITLLEELKNCLALKLKPIKNYYITFSTIKIVKSGNKFKVPGKYNQLFPKIDWGKKPSFYHGINNFLTIFKVN